MGSFVNVKVNESLGLGALEEEGVCDFGIWNAEFENRKEVSAISAPQR